MGLTLRFSNIQLEDSRLKAKATLEQKGYKSYVLKEVPGIRLGTQLELENINPPVSFFYLDLVAASQPIP
jgi:hypothetical protein